MRRRRPLPAVGHVPDSKERAIVEALARLRNTTVREVMTPRVDVTALPAPVTADAVALAVKRSGHSRFPVYQDTLDDLKGVLFVKDLFRSAGDPRLRKPFVVPEARLVLELLHEMQSRRIAFAVVVDEHGGVEGVLTIKDLVGELVGDLLDEFDHPEEPEISRVDAERWLVDGACPADRVGQELGLELPEGEYRTLGGFLFARFGRIPAEGDRAEHDGWEFTVAEMDRRRIAKVVLRAPSGNISRHGK